MAVCHLVCRQNEAAPHGVVADSAHAKGAEQPEAAKPPGFNAMDILKREERKKEVLAFRAALEESIPLEMASSVPLPKSRSQFMDLAGAAAPAIAAEEPPMEWFFNKPREGWRNDALDPSKGLPQAQKAKVGANPAASFAPPRATHGGGDGGGGDDDDDDGRAESWADRTAAQKFRGTRSRPPSAPQAISTERSARTSQQALATLSHVELQVVHPCAPPRAASSTPIRRAESHASCDGFTGRRRPSLKTPSLKFKCSRSSSNASC